MKSIIQIRFFTLVGVFAFLLSGCDDKYFHHHGSNESSSVAVSSSISSMVSVVSSSSVQLSSITQSSSVQQTSSSVQSSSSVSSISSQAAVVVSTLARAAAFNGDGLRLDKNGNVFVGTSKGHTVFRVTPSGEISLFATLASGSANGSYFDSNGNLYVANETDGIIHKITPEGEVSDFLTGLDGPAGIYIDEQDNLFVGLFGYSAPSSKVLKITMDKTITTYATGGGLTNVVGITGDGHGRYFASNFLTGEIFEVTDGNVRQIGASGTRVNHMKYSNGYIYTPNPLDHVIRRMDLNGNFELLAGTKSVAGSDDGDGTSATFSRPNSIDVSADGKTLYVLDFNTGDVRMIKLNN